MTCTDEIVRELTAVFAEQEAMQQEPLARGETSRETKEMSQHKLRHWDNFRPATGHFPKDQGRLYTETRDMVGKSRTCCT